jgi:hypothetical protein
MSQKEGVFLRSEIDGKNVYADYFPHIPLGDDSVDVFLKGFKEQKTEYQRKIMQLLKDDYRFQEFPAKEFRNHQLWSGSEEIQSPVIKYKMLHPHDQIFHEALKQGVRVRLDANAMFTASNMHLLIDSIKPEWSSLIDYVEDPLSTTDWSGFPLKKARDFISGTPFDLYIYKPNCEMLPSYPNLIFSAYLGHALGNWHTYCELLENGNTQMVQGIIGSGFYDDVSDLFIGDFENGFSPDLNIVKENYRALSRREWTPLCSM